MVSLLLAATPQRTLLTTVPLIFEDSDELSALSAALLSTCHHLYVNVFTCILCPVNHHLNVGVAGVGTFSFFFLVRDSKNSSMSIEAYSEVNPYQCIVLTKVHFLSFSQVDPFIVLLFRQAHSGQQ
ncbi:hypothetical protein CHARACLAT_005076 [Characodon lateralis]|uniref:Uncharacterized protein n=1 Tax=Characodon lateralis TaxID=208331 RepID=A0ABU7DNG3_9TELE|nr:hypothetical protein [Characodon lateralis]